MKYEQRIVAVDSKYVGFLLMNEEVIFTTEQQETAKQASEHLKRYFLNPNSNKETSSIQQPTINIFSQTRQTSPVRSSCCGRG